MPYQGNSAFDHANKPAVGVLLTNLGTPDAPTKPALRRYLKQFLSDRRVVEIPKPLWWLILNGIILNTRPAKSAKLYQSIWHERGSPLALHTQDQTAAIAAQLTREVEGTSHQIVVRYAMRYGQPAVAKVITEMLNNGVEKLVILPLYPQYASSTTGSTFDAVARLFQQTRRVPEFRFITQYHDEPDYIEACATQIQSHWQQQPKADKLLFSFHGLPKFHLEQGDPYFCQCHKTARLIAEKLGLCESEYVVAFQSRFGRTEWLKPYTDETLKQLTTSGVQSVDVFCPGFASDCLETLEEIAVENKQYFIEAGGERYSYIPALNAQPQHIEALTKLVLKNIQDWVDRPARNADQTKANYRAIKQQVGY